MTILVREIPPAERRVRWSTLVWFRWPMGLLGVFLVVYGGLVALMLMFASGGKPRDDRRLDASDVLRSMALVTDVKPSEAWLDDLPADRITYTFESQGGHAETGRTFGHQDSFVEGREYPVEYLPGETEKNRLVGTRIGLLEDMVSPVLGAVVLPGVLVLLLWLQSLWSLRMTLAHGDVAVARLTRIERVRGVVPVTVRAYYRFRDHHARWCEGAHWVRARSLLGEQMAQPQREVAVVHDRARPERSRLVTASDFAGSRPRQREGEAAQRV